MSSLLELLQEIDPTISASMAADLRTAWVAINQQVQAESASASWSLNTWWRWLEEEGYDCEAALAAARHYCQARIGAEALDVLTQRCRSDADSPEGLSVLFDQLDQLDPELGEDIHELEQLAFSEESELQQVAGGLSKRGKFDVIVGGAGVTYGIYLYYNKKKQKEFEAAVNAMDKAMRQGATNEYDKVSGLDKGDLFNKVSKAANSAERTAGFDARRAEAELFNAYSREPQETLQRLSKFSSEVYNNSKDINTYVRKDIDDLVAKLVAEHTLAYLGKVALDKADAEIKTSPEFRRRLAQATLESLKEMRPGLKLSGQELNSEAGKAEQKVTGGDWFQQERLKLLKSPRFVDLHNREVNVLRNVYTQLVENEVATAKKESEAAWRDDSDFLRMRRRFIDGKLVHTTVMKVDQDIVRKFAAAERDFLDAERAAERDASGFIEEL